jgi:calcineurin-like phosphoesterase family protein
MVNRWYISDHHFYHHNILKYGQRPFANLNEMHDALLEKHNAMVKPNDHVSFLGDVTILRGGRTQREMFSRLVKKFQGHKRLYLGNHDHFPIQTYLDVGFEKIYATWRSDEGIIFSHFPLHPRSLSSAIANVHGHIHQAKMYDPVKFDGIIGEAGTDKRKVPPRIIPYINVSCEVVNYTPIHLDELLLMVKKVNNEL